MSLRLIFLHIVCLIALQASALLPKDYVWESMSENSSGSMPVGGGSVGLNVWAEDGDV